LPGSAAAAGRGEAGACKGKHVGRGTREGGRKREEDEKQAYESSKLASRTHACFFSGSVRARKETGHGKESVCLERHTALMDDNWCKAASEAVARTRDRPAFVELQSCLVQDDYDEMRRHLSRL